MPKLASTLLLLSASSLSLSSALLGQATRLYTEAFTQGVMCYDQARERLVFALPSRHLWEWDGQTWAMSPVQLPQGAQHATFDAFRRRVYFVAGQSLYEYDGHSVTGTPLPPAPYAMPVTNLISEYQRGKLLMLRTEGLVTIGAYEFDGVAWQQVSAPPVGRAALRAAYDGLRDRVVLMTAVPGISPADETWEWDGAQWSMRLAGVSQYAPIAFDPVLGQVISSGSPTKVWNGVVWTPLASGITPPTSLVTFGADPGRGRLWAYSNQGSSESIWAWDGVAWAEMPMAPHPVFAPRVSAYDDVRDRVMLLGTRRVEWNGSAWRDLAAGGPGNLELPAGAFDRARGKLVLFGGSTGTGLYSPDTWTYGATGWSLASSSGPTGRTNSAMAYDSQRARVVMVGGTAAFTYLADHWEWDGVSWSQVSANVPMGPDAGNLGYDEGRARMVFVNLGGHTWEYDGIGWQFVATGGPRTRFAYDPARLRLQGNANGQRLEWDGVAWTQRFAASGELILDTRRGAMLTYGPGSFTGEFAALARTDDYGSPCGGSATATSLVAFGSARPGNGAFHLDLRADAAQSPTLLGFAFAQANVAVGHGCTALLQGAFASALRFTSGDGFAEFPVALPNDLSLRGIVFHAQGGVLDPASPGGFALTQGLSVTIGD